MAAPLPSCCSQIISTTSTAALVAAVLLLVTTATTAPAAVAVPLKDDVEFMWGPDHSFFSDDGTTLALCLEKTHGSGFRSKGAYLYARYDIDVKLVANNSAGTVTTVYLTTDDVRPGFHDEVDMEFLGNVTGQPYTLHTNIFVDSVGNREQQFRLWFDPTKDFHTYSVQWTPNNIIFLIDGRAIRVYKHEPSSGKTATFPTQRQMRLDGSLWNADDWATQGGRVKTDWAHAPFYAYYRNLRVTPCAPSSSSSSPGVALCSDELLPASAELQKVRAEHMLYDYCEDQNRFKQTGFPRECTAH